ncbi:DUF551 domain-containing protein [Klebsiella pneumoniae]|nr:DUF551 domain-containing protein [Klebsiella pneumoniae]MCI8053076.1 DUF551 domain-containing protein [Klebsiella pneumoniae]
MARMALAAMESESECLPLDYLQGHKDGLEWAAQLAEANHPETGDWLYDDPIELAKAIRKGPDMPPAQPVEDSEPDCNERQLFCSTDTARMRKVISVSAGSEATPLYRHAQPAPVVPEKCPAEIRDLISSHTDALFNDDDAQEIWNACRAAMLQAGSDEIGSWGNDKYPPSDKPNPIDHGYRPDCECTGCKATARICAELAGWIPVSERMPEDDDFVYIWPRPDFGVELHIGQYCERNHKGGGWYAQVYEQNYGIEWHPITVTHWMPLPAGPQEVK